jgi:hypothetical protein
MDTTYDKNGHVISRCRNLRYALERARRVPVVYVGIVPTDRSIERPCALVHITWRDGAYMRTNFASFKVAKALFERKALSNPRQWPSPVFNY